MINNDVIILLLSIRCLWLWLNRILFVLMQVQ